MTVRSSAGGRGRDLCLAVLCSVEAAELRLKSGEATALPVLLTRGKLETTERVVRGLEQCFDCVVARLELEERDLQWMAAMWAGLRRGELAKTGAQDSGQARRVLGETTNTGPGEAEQPKENDKDEVVKLVYGLPASLGPEVREQVRHMTLEFPADQLRQVWLCCREEATGNEFTEREMEAFHRSLALHTRSTLGLCLDKLELLQVQLPALRVHRGGRVAFGAACHVKTVLRLLTELCQGEVLEANPTLAVVGEEGVDTISMDYTVYKG